MSWAHQPSQSDFRLILTRVSDLKTGNYIGALYIGVGDQFGVGASSDGTSLEAQDGAIVTVKSSGWGALHVRFGSKGGMCAAKGHVCLTLERGRARRIGLRLLWAKSGHQRYVWLRRYCGRARRFRVCLCSADPAT
jgi:hypothetical protein